MSSQIDFGGKSAWISALRSFKSASRTSLAAAAAQSSFFTPTSFDLFFSPVPPLIPRRATARRPSLRGQQRATRDPTKTFPHGPQEEETARGDFYSDLMHMMKGDGNMQKALIVNVRLSLLVSPFTCSSHFFFCCLFVPALSPLRCSQVDPPRGAAQRPPADSHRQRPHQSVHHDPVAAAP